MYTLVITSDPNSNSQIASVRVRELGYAQQRGKRRVAGTWWVLVAGKGPDEELVKGPTRTWAPGVGHRRQSPSCRRARGRESESAHAG
jgi:hypothetical protein